MRLATVFVYLATTSLAVGQSLPVPVVSSCPAVPQAKAGSYSKQTILYETTADGQQEYLDLYIPNGVNKPPLAMTIHGGSFVAGDKATNNVVPLSLSLVSLGWEVASINYRLSGAHGFANLFPAPLQDSLCALQWLKSNGGGNPHIIVAGLSAGGGIANWIATLGQTGNPAYASPTCQYASVSTHVSGVASFYGFSDFADVNVYKSLSDLDSWDTKVFGFTVAEQPATLAADSPVNNLHSTVPPYFVADGLADAIILPAQVANYGNALRAASVPTNLIQAPGVGHGFAPFNAALGAIPCTFVAWLAAVRQL